MIYPVGDLAAKIDAIYDRYVALSLGDNSIAASPLATVLEDLGTSLEELRVTQEELLQQNEALLQSRLQADAERLRYFDLFETAPEAYMVTDAHGHILEANQQAHVLLQMGSRSLTGQALANFVPAQERSAFQTLIRNTDGIIEREMRLAPAGAGSPIDVSVFMASVPGPHGPTDALRWLIRPLSITLELERYQMLVSEARDYAIILTDSEGMILDWNAGAEQILGYAANETRGKNLALIFTAEERENGVPGQEMRQAEATGRAIDERWHLRKNGSLFWASGSLTALRSGGRVRWFAKVLRDQTTEKRSVDETAHDLRRVNRIAQTLQQDMLPQIAADAFPGLLVAALYEAAWDEAQVGGDFYDAFSLANGQVVIAVGDVSGKGLGAALRASEIRTALRAVLREHSDPIAALIRLNAFVCDRARLDGEVDYLYATLVLVILDPHSGKIACALAGADPVLILKSGRETRTNGKRTAIFRPETAGAAGMMLGVTDNTIYNVEETFLEQGDRLLLVTDGIIEARRERAQIRQGEERVQFLGIEGVATIASQIAAESTVTHLCRAVLEGAHAFSAGRLADDACILAVERL